MIKFEQIEVWGIKHAIRGMRNPLNSWERSDTVFDGDKMCLGENDVDLMTRLIHGGAPHRKFLRQIFVSVDITAPLYWWKEFDTYTDVERKQFWWNMIQLLPSSFNQKRTVTMTYENLLNMLEYRRGHKLDEWRMFCDWILTLPHGSLLKEGVGNEQS